MSDPGRTDLAVVGAGPAGLCAAATAAELGLQVTIVDENPLPGGQYYRQHPSGFSRRADGDPLLRHEEAARVLAVTTDPRVRLLARTTVWGVFDDRTLALHGPDVPETLHARAIVLAAGAYDKPFPFPGWTVPGVYTVGGLQTLVKAQGLLPGGRMLLAGNGPLLLATAAQILDAGGDIAAVVEASPMHRLAALPSLLRHRDVLREGIGYLSRLRRAHVPLLTRHVVVRVEGDDAVARAVVAPLGPGARPDLERTRTFVVDAVGIGCGFVPSIELLRAAGGQVVYSREAQAWVPRRDTGLEAAPGVYVAGDNAGIRGSRVARAEGALAGVGAARALGAADPDVAERRSAGLRKELAGLESLQRAINRMYQAEYSPIASLTPETLVCRCEAVSARAIDEAIDDGAASLHELKAYTRAGMGFCQARVCGPLCEAILRDRLDLSGADDLAAPSVRPPLKPLSVDALAQLDLDYAHAASSAHPSIGGESSESAAV